MYSVELTIFAEKKLSKLPVDAQNRIIAGLERFRIRPHAFAKKLVSSPYFRFRVGDYRIICDIQNGKLVILVIDVAHRKKVYKN